METGLSASDVLAIQAERNNGYGYGNNGFFGNDGAMMLFFLLAWGNNGFGGFGGNGALNQVNNDFLYTNLRSELQNGFGQVYNGQRELSNGLCNGFYAMNTGMLQGFNATQRELAENRFAQQNCCCETNRNIDALRYEAAKNTCDIIAAGNANTQAIIDKLTATEVQNLRDALNTANLQLSQQAQSANLINTLKPQAVPAYPSCSPYESVVYGARNWGGWGNYGNGCGCAC